MNKIRPITAVLDHTGTKVIVNNPEYFNILGGGIFSGSIIKKKWTFMDQFIKDERRFNNGFNTETKLINAEFLTVTGDHEKDMHYSPDVDHSFDLVKLFASPGLVVDPAEKINLIIAEII